MKEYQRIRRSDPDVRLKHNETERKRLQNKRATQITNEQQSLRQSSSTNRKEYKAYDGDFRTPSDVVANYDSNNEWQRNVGKMLIADYGGLARAA
jgi:hypothetical protein